MGILVIMVYGFYCAVAFLIAHIIAKNVKSLFVRIVSYMVLICIPFLDTVLPGLLFAYYCDEHAYYETGTIATNVNGFYSEDADGYCNLLCDGEAFNLGYDYIEGNIRRGNNKYGPRKYNLLPDLTPGLYRISNISADKTKCIAPYKFFESRIRGKSWCVLADPLESMRSEYSYIRNVKTGNMYLGDITTLTATISDVKRNYTIAKWNVIRLKGRPFLTVNTNFWRRGCSNPELRKQNYGLITSYLVPSDHLMSK